MVTELSIFIPVYNRSVIQLVQDLVQQASTISIPVEIRVYDDGSLLEYKRLNHSLASIPQVIYQELPANIGRSQIRYLLAQEARYKTLLFLDNDVLLVSSDFLARYINQHTGAVTVGGVCYQDTPPVSAFYLRWLYGKAREQALAQERQKAPYNRVFLSNLVVEKEVFLKHFQRDTVTAYGHEDTLFASQLRQHQLPVHHIDNPVEHLGLETGEVFLEKTLTALQNLVQLQKAGKLGQESKLLQVHQRLQKIGIMVLLRASSSWLMPLLKEKLFSKKPSLQFFDVYRLMLLDQLMRRK
ncbi:hypothetical protein TH61_13600 [Rufibacter sp. DG15C]|uniref:glycosyltransferase family 2 protein n=1 Tax=Rufibacter sp. DG15C TaxID=1379909 RepID=UPI00078E40E3|nr:glycosyltransferase [Rufibacter sp. DG15C]AMM52010.1 hypothetical protein TH61_13600 [Rufibacter sp. DG15C]